MDEQTKAAFASAADVSKQLITLATALLTLEITFAKDVIGKLNSPLKCLIGISWILLLVSVVAGVWTLLALTGSLGQSTAVTPNSISGGNVRIPAILQILLFLGGLSLTVAFGIWAIGGTVAPGAAECFSGTSPVAGTKLSFPKSTGVRVEGKNHSTSSIKGW